VIRPERDQPLDERAVAPHPRRKRGLALRRRNPHQRPARLLPGVPAQVVGWSLGDRAKSANRLGNGVRRALGRGTQDRRTSLQLCAKPRAWIANAVALACAGAEPKPVEGTKRGVHASTSIPLDDNRQRRAPRHRLFTLRPARA
jgi:hypothetical protein